MLQVTDAREELPTGKVHMPPSAHSNPWAFFALTFGASWLFWLAAAASGQAEPAPLVLSLHYLGGLAPLVVAVTLTIVTQDRQGRRDYWQRAVALSRIGGGWYGVILLAVPLLTALGILADLLLGGRGAQLEAAARILRQPLSALPFATFTLLFGPVPEELAWRGYALDRLQARWNALTSSVLLGTAWTLWHLPLFLIQGSYQQGLVGSPSAWLFMMDKIPQSILMTWIYNHTRRSTLSAILLHFMVNLVGELLQLTQRAELYTVVAWIIAAAAVTLVWGPRTLTRPTASAGRTGGATPA
jgi:membrane protease YdiL (CAAX protease family)